MCLCCWAQGWLAALAGVPAGFTVQALGFTAKVLGSTRDSAVRGDMPQLSMSLPGKKQAPAAASCHMCNII